MNFYEFVLNLGFWQWVGLIIIVSLLTQVRFFNFKYYKEKK